MEDSFDSTDLENINILTKEHSNNENIISNEIFMGMKKPIPLDYSQNIIRHKINECVGKIEYQKIKDGNNVNCTGSCFFCKLPKINKVFLITNNHVFGKEELNSFKTLDILIDDKIKKQIDLSNKRFKYSNILMDFTAIEIFESDNINRFLLVDDMLFDSDYENEKIYNLGFPLGQKMNFSNGCIKKIQNKTIFHNISTLPGSSGSPILLESNHKVIGIHRGSLVGKNVGISIKEIIEDIILMNPNIKNEENEELIIKLYYKFLKKVKKGKTLLFIFAIIINIIIILYKIPTKRKKVYYKNSNIVK